MHATIADFVTEIAHNAIEAGAPAILVDVAEEGDFVEVTVADNGPGMDAETRRRALDPFAARAKHPHRRVGLGLPGLRQAVEQAGGEFDLRSEPGRGTSVFFRLDRRHADTPPLGDLPGALVGLIAFEGDYELRATRRRDGRSYALSRGELKRALGGLDDAGALELARRYAADLEDELMKGAGHGPNDLG